MRKSTGHRSIEIVKSALLYFGIVFGTGFVLGPIRVLVLEPRLGAFAAGLCETPFLLLAIGLAAWKVPQWLRTQSQPGDMLAMGFGALALALGADFIVGLTLRAMTFRDQLAYFSTSSGQLFAALLGIFALMPAVAHSVRTRH